MNKKGFTLVETLGALIVFGILVALLSFLVSFFIRANERISISSLANEEGNLIVRRIQEDLIDLTPNTYETCPGEACYIFKKEFVYEYNETTNQIELVVYDEAITYKLEIENNKLYINDEEYDFDTFILSSDSLFNVTEENNDVYIKINIVIESEKNDLFEFLMSYSFTKEAIPNE